MLRSALSLASFLTAFAVVAGGIRVMRPFPEVPGIYQKWRFFSQHADRYDVLFFGTSRLYHHVIPAQFDAAVQAASPGQPTIRSFNFGYDALWPPEQFYLLEQVLRRRPARLRWVVLDAMEPVVRLDERNARTRRTAYWHDPRRTVYAWRVVAGAALPRLEKLRLWLGHAALGGREWANSGWAAEWLAYEFGVERRKKASRWDPPREWRDTEGYEPEPETPMSGEVLADYLAELSARHASFPPTKISPAYAAGLRRAIAVIRAAGAEPLMVVSPSVEAGENFVGFPEGLRVLHFADPQGQAALFDPAVRADRLHLNPRGAELFTRRLAERFVTETGR